ncbi:MAG: CvpA family protein [Deltaproteobacteria bacterium]|nr:CvpA family protein [Deltaproteobacteria bacterium]MBW2691791.1 CvpA family protein [Deltaproteobacteria bacterium]
MAEFESVDIVVGAIIGIACLRGFFLGLIREAFSLASLAAAYIAVKAFVGPVSEWVGDISGGRINEALEPWVAGALLVLVTIGAVTTVGRIIRRGARAVGLGFVDRVGGGLLGATEGVLVVIVLLMLVGDRIGRDHPAIANTRTLAALEEMELLASEAPPTEIDVASPPKSD